MAFCDFPRMRMIDSTSGHGAARTRVRGVNVRVACLVLDMLGEVWRRGR